MAFNPATDFIGLWRNAGGTVSKLEMPGLDYVVMALARAGVITISVSATAPVANQSTTAWLQTAVPDWSAEGTLQLWNKVTTAYAPATPALFLQFLEASAGESGVSWWTTTGGTPANTIGNDGDYALRTDNPGGIYGPKVAGAWPLSPLPGTTNTIESVALDNAFGGVPGTMIVRGTSEWDALQIGAPGTVLASVAGLPTWDVLSTLLDTVFSSVQGSVLYRGAALWNDLPPDTDDHVLTTHGAGADPSWTAKSSEFSSGTVMVFRQTAAPTGWVKQTSVSDYGLRVTSGTVGIVAGTPFSSVFSQTAVAGHVLQQTEMPAHTHSTNAAANVGGSSTGGGVFSINTPAGATNGVTGSGDPHAHDVLLQLAYVDVIVATKA